MLACLQLEILLREKLGCDISWKLSILQLTSLYDNNLFRLKMIISLKFFRKFPNFLSNISFL